MHKVHRKLTASKQWCNLYMDHSNDPAECTLATITSTLGPPCPTCGRRTAAKVPYGPDPTFDPVLSAFYEATIE